MRRLLLILLLAGCSNEGTLGLPEAPVDLGPPDDPAAYVADLAYGRAVLERDLTSLSNDYAQRRLSRYGLAAVGWALLPERDVPSRPLTDADVAAALAGEPFPDGGELSALTPDQLPTSEEAWIELGRRVFFEYPLREEATYSALLTMEGALDEVGFLRDGEAWVGLRIFDDGDGLVVGNTCAQCHASADPETGELSARLANREMDVGAARLLAAGLTPGDLPPELDSTTAADWDRLGPGRTDVLPDNRFDPYAFPDMGGIADLPYLHHNGNWRHRGVATLAVRCETLFITSNSERTRIPRVLAWALAVYYRSLEAPPPLYAGDGIPPEAERGAEVFEEVGCDECHVPPLYTSDREVRVAEIGTDPLAGDSPSRRTGHYRIPSLRGVSHTAPYLHHGAFDDLEQMFEPGREVDEPGHTFGLDLEDADRAALIAFLRTL